MKRHQIKLNLQNNSTPLPKTSFSSRLYDCLCDIQITKCTLTYAWYDSLNTENGFPYYYIISNLTHHRAVDDSPENYTSSFLCETLTQTRLRSLNCHRMTISDNTCEGRECQKYSVQLNAHGSTCSSSCGMLIWAANYDLKIVYFNFGDIPQPVKDGVCLENDATTIESTTRAEAFTTSEAGANYTEFKRIKDPDVTSAKRSILPVPILAGLAAAAGGILLLTIAAVAFCRNGKGSKKVRVRNDSDTGTGSTFSSELSDKTDLARVETSSTSTSSDEIDPTAYHTLDEMSDSVGRETIVAECDEQGYSIIQDCEHKGCQSREARDARRHRPLPQAPNSRSKCIQSAATDPPGRSAGQMPITHLTSSWNLGSPLSAASKKPEDGLPIFPVRHTRLPNMTESVAFPPAPRPHRRLEVLDDHDYMGLVNLRQNDHVSGLKLVRTQQGHLELVSGQEGSLAFSDYYTRILLINQTGGSLGVVGMMDLEEQADDNLAEVNHSLDTRESETRAAELVSDNENVPGADRDVMKSTLDRYIYITYIGSLSIAEDSSLYPCDYLTALDIDPEDISSESDGYLTVLDIDNVSRYASSGSYLDLIHEC